MKVKLIYDGNSKFCEFEPAGLKESKLKYMRHNTYNSVLRSVVQPIRFVKTDKEWIESWLNLYGFEINIYIYFYTQNAINLTDELYYSGILDLSTAVIDRDMFECEIIDNDKVAKLIARDDIELNIDQDTDEDGNTLTNLQKTTDINLTAFNPYNYAQYYVTADDTKQVNFVGNIYGFNEPVNITMLFDTFGLTGDKVYENLTGNQEPAFINLVAKYETYASVTNISISLPSIFRFKLSAIRYDSNNVAQETQYFGNAQFIITEDEQFFSYVVPNVSIPFVCESGDYIKIFIYREFFLAENQPNDSHAFVESYTLSAYQQPCYTNVPYDPIPAGDFKAYLLHETITTALWKITGEGNVFMPVFGRTESEPYIYPTDGYLGNVLMLSGNQLRKLNVDFRVKFKDLFENFNKIKPLGLWYNSIDDFFYIDEFQNFYKNSLIFTLGSVTDFKKTLAEELIYNQIEVGSAADDGYNTPNGKNEYHGKVQFANTIKKIKNTINLVSAYRMDTFGILDKRSEQTDNKSNENENDNTIFLVDCNYSEVGGGRVYQNRLANSATGTQNAFQMLNLRISPKRMLINNIFKFSYLVNLKGTINKLLSFKNNKNIVNIESKIEATDDIISETSNENLLSYPVADFIYDTWYYEFNYPVNVNILNQLKQDPHGYIKFESDGIEYEGFLIDAEINMLNFETKWKLLKKY